MAREAVVAGVIREELEANPSTSWEDFKANRERSLKRKGLTVSKRYFDKIRGDYLSGITNLPPAPVAPDTTPMAAGVEMPTEVSKAIGTIVSALGRLEWSEVTITDGKVVVIERPRTHVLDLRERA